MNILELKDCTMRFGGLVSVNKLNAYVGDNELVGIIGPNGAGKTTVFNMITGVYDPSEGDILFNGESIVKYRPFEVAGKGISRTFQNIRLFDSMTVRDNVRVSFGKNLKSNFVTSIIQGAGFHKEEKDVETKTEELLDMFDMKNEADWSAKSLPYGDQRKLEIVRALATSPRLLLLDEPAAGMNPTEKVELMQLIRDVKEKFKIAIVLIEHDMKVVMGVCERIFVLDHGVKIAEGVPEVIQKDPKVIEAYLGQ